MPEMFQEQFCQSVKTEFSPVEENIGEIPLLRGEFWTSAQRQGHPLHEISYRACFKPELARFLISRLSKPGDGVLDPFMGRGTTVLEAALMNRRAIGNDINPLSTMLVRPRLASLCIAAVQDWLQAQNLDSAPESDIQLAMQMGLDAFYHPATLADLCALRRILMDIQMDDDHTGRAADWVRMVALNRLTGHSPGFFSGRTMPPNQAVSVASQRRINQRLGTQPPIRDIEALIMRKTRSLLRGGMPRDCHSQLWTGSASLIPGIADGSVSLVVTSPPFLDVVQYADDNWLRCWFAGIDVGAIPMGIHRTLDDWEAMMTGAMQEMSRVLGDGGHACVEVGEVRKGTVRLEEGIIRAAAGTGLEPVCVLVNEQNFTKTASLWGVGNMTGGTNTNRIVVLRKS